MTAKRIASRLRNNLRLCTLDGLLSTPMVFATLPGNFIMAALLTTVFGLDKTTYGFIASLPAWFNAAQIAVVPLLAPRLSPRKMNLGFAIAQLFFWIVFCIALPFMPRDDVPTVTRLLFVSLATVSLTGSLTGVGWTSWIQEWIPRRLRGKYFGQRNRLASLVTIGFLAVAGELVRLFGEEITGYLLIFATAAVLRLLSILNQFRIITPTVHQPATIHRGWWRGFSAVLSNRDFLLLVAFCSHAAFWMNFTGPFGPIFMYEHLGLKVSHVTLASIVGSLAGALSWPVWGRFVDRFNCRLTIVVSLILWEGQNYLWALLMPKISWMVFPMFAWGGLTAAGYFIGTFNLLLKLISQETKTTAVSVNLAVTSLAAAVAPILAGVLLDHARDFNLESLTVYRSMFVLKSTALLLSLFMLRRLREPASGGIGSLMGAMRTLRQTMLIEGLAIFSNFTPVRQLSRKKR